MTQNITLSVGNVALINKINDEYNYFDFVFNNVGGKAKNVLSSTKLFMYNRLNDCFSINQIIPGYGVELFEFFNFSKIPSDRSIYRDLIRLGKNLNFIVERHQNFLRLNNLDSDIQYVDFSSTYFEGGNNSFAEYGYSRDSQPNKKQLTFGVSTGINNIPSALTIQNGNVPDKTHFKFMIKASEAILKEGSLLIFDTGGNTKDNKKVIREKNFHYLTLKAKKITPYKKAIEKYDLGTKIDVCINKSKYFCVKYVVGEEVNYIFFNEELKNTQLATKERKFKKMLDKNNKILQKTKSGKIINEFITVEGTVTTKGSLQKILEEIENPHINGLEGFFILESSIDTDPFKILCLYKDKDKAEKFFRSVKEGAELRPMRHWNTDAIKGYILIIFLTTFIVNLTLLRTRNPLVKNFKLLKKHLSKLTLVKIYDKNNKKQEFLANITPEITSILGEYIKKFCKIT